MGLIEFRRMWLLPQDDRKRELWRLRPMGRFLVKGKGQMTLWCLRKADDALPFNLRVTADTPAPDSFLFYGTKRMRTPSQPLELDQSTSTSQSSSTSSLDFIKDSMKRYLLSISVCRFMARYIRKWRRACKRGWKRWKQWRAWLGASYVPSSELLEGLEGLDPFHIDAEQRGMICFKLKALERHFIRHEINRELPYAALSGKATSLVMSAYTLTLLMKEAAVTSWPVVFSAACSLAVGLLTLALSSGLACCRRWWVFISSAMWLILAGWRILTHVFDRDKEYLFFASSDIHRGGVDFYLLLGMATSLFRLPFWHSAIVNVTYLVAAIFVSVSFGFGGSCVLDQNDGGICHNQSLRNNEIGLHHSVYAMSIIYMSYYTACMDYTRRTKHLQWLQILLRDAALQRIASKLLPDHVLQEIILEPQYHQIAHEVPQVCQLVSDIENFTGQDSEGRRECQLTGDAAAAFSAAVTVRVGAGDLRRLPPEPSPKDVCLAASAYDGGASCGVGPLAGVIAESC
ncbi:hypothetical protein CYMTET_10911 [Cymbomonas tetramitiformis]|uniref:Transmembrane protein n=1 Tax=Cymbomonas tetramitiformis TaxID=36881 RepID=A0AAE0GN75_9CHLO|nr:hypothetical protein CYMTET_10911 [Cymbomonas tetramitiformis]